MDGGDVGVGDVDGEGQVGVDVGEVDLEGSEFDGDEVESWVFGFGTDESGGRRGRDCSD